jgi:asparagine synthetase B (glutamine-hydrolysing)
LSITTSIATIMCGIFCSISRHDFIGPDAATTQLLRNRGPDSIGQHQVLIGADALQDAGGSCPLHATFLSTVLSLRGTSVVNQPLQDSHVASILCWNGEAWSVGQDLVAGNDSQLIFAKLLAASSDADCIEASIRAIIALMSSIRGPYAFVFYDALHKLVYYGRDCLGRRSLLRKTTSDDTIILSSVCDNASGDSWTEVEADGIYIVDLNSTASTQLSSLIGHVPHRLSNEVRGKGLSFVGKFPSLDTLLMKSDVAFSSYEPQHARGLFT